MNIEKIENNKAAKKNELIFYVNCFISMQYFCIFLDMISEMIAVEHKDRHLGFAKYYKIIAIL